MRSSVSDRGRRGPGGGFWRHFIVLVVLCCGFPSAAPEGTRTAGVHVSLAPIWFDPAATSGIVTPYRVMHAPRDAMIKPMPEGNRSPGTPRSWTMSKDRLTWDFVLREEMKFHNGEAVTALGESGIA